MEFSFLLNKVTLGNCLEVIKYIPDNSIDCIICDLPYGIKSKAASCSWDNKIPIYPLWRNYKRIIKNNGAILLFATQPFASELIYKSQVPFRFEWIWHKNKGANFASIKKRPFTVHESILVFSKKQANYYPQKEYGYSTYVNNERMRNSYSSVVKQNCNHALVGGTGNHNTDGSRYPKSVLYFPKEHTSYHPTQKPIALLEYLIKTHTLENDLILDNCCGSGSTLVAAKNLNRNFIGIEINNSYKLISEARLENKTIDIENNKVAELDKLDYLIKQYEKHKTSKG